MQAGPFYPVIEVDNPGAIITDSPFELMKSGKLNPIPFIAGYNTDEGTLGLKSYLRVTQIESVLSILL